jgi:hypothetical protein
MQSLLKKLKAGFRKQEEKLVPWEALDQYDEKLRSIGDGDPSSPTSENYLTEVDLSPCKIQAFLCSNHKNSLGNEECMSRLFRDE